MELGINFDNCGSLHAPVPGLPIYLGIDVEFGQEGLEITLVIGGKKASLEVIIEGQLLVYISFSWWLSASSTS